MFVKSSKQNLSWASANDGFDDKLSYIYCFLNEKKFGQNFSKMDTV